jgi:muconate cycloisomerase
MRCRSLTAYVVRLPLRRPFAHASATRRESESLLVRCELENGTFGWGEGVPRAYVTGETPAGAMSLLKATDLPALFQFDADSWRDVIAACDRLHFAVDSDDPRDCKTNALRCAVELSLLDAYGRLFGEPLSVVASHVPEMGALLNEHKTVRYSTAIDATAATRPRRNALKMRLYGFAQCKVKVGARDGDDAMVLRTIRRWLGSHVDLRVDANEAWTAENASARIEPLLASGISCVEQPVPHAEVDAMATLRNELPVPIMLDESLTSGVDASRAIEGGTCDLFNLRLSKCGGYVRCLRLAAMARDAGLGYQLGCHPGESAILSAAGRHWATSVAGIRYLEGSYDRHLLGEPLSREDITFGYGGRAPALTGAGLGITVDRSAVERLAVQTANFPLD